MEMDINEADIRMAIDALTKGIDGFMLVIRTIRKLVTVFLDNFFETRNFVV